MALNWYAARTEPRAEYLAAHELRRDGYEIYLPCIKSTHPQKGRPDVPLFPGYLFLRCDPEGDGWPLFRRKHRLLGWVSFGAEVPWLPDEIMAELMERSETINRQGGLWRRFLPGEKVDVVSGSIQGLAEVVEEAKTSRSRVKVLLDFMGRQVLAQIPSENLRPLEEQPSEESRVPRRTRGKGRWIQGWGSRAAAAT